MSSNVAPTATTTAALEPKSPGIHHHESNTRNIEDCKEKLLSCSRHIITLTPIPYAREKLVELRLAQASPCNGTPPKSVKLSCPINQSHYSSVTLGRNTHTNICDVSVSRTLAEVVILPNGSGFVSMKKRPEDHRVHLNGKKVAGKMNEFIPLANGSMLSLFEDRYSYRVGLQFIPADGTSDRSDTLAPASAIESVPAMASISTSNKDIHLQQRYTCPSLLHEVNRSQSRRRQQPHNKLNPTNQHRLPNNTSRDNRMNAPQKCRKKINNLSNLSKKRPNLGPQEVTIDDTDEDDTNDNLHEQQQQEDDEDDISVSCSKSQKLMVEEMTCSICMDIIVKSTFCIPCGHVFCRQCVENLKPTGSTCTKKNDKRKKHECPNCRKDITSLMFTFHTDNIILSMVKRGDFEVDDALHFLKRSEIKLSDLEMKAVLGEKNALKRKNNTKFTVDQRNKAGKKRKNLDENKTKQRQQQRRAVDIINSQSINLRLVSQERVSGTSGNGLNDAIFIE